MGFDLKITQDISGVTGREEMHEDGDVVEVGFDYLGDGSEEHISSWVIELPSGVAIELMPDGKKYIYAPGEHHHQGRE